MPRIGFCEAGIEVDGKRLEEYRAQTDDKTVSTWVESEAEKQFAIVFHWHASGINSSLQLGIEMDGIALASYVIRPQTMGKSIKIRRVAVGGDMWKHFFFSATSVTDDENLASPNGISQDFGTVKIIVKCGTSSPSERRSTLAKDLEDSPVHERSKKVTTHRISLGKETRMNLPIRHTFICSPDYPDPVAIFKFMYRSRSFLQAQELIPPDSPTLQPIDAKVPKEFKSEEAPSAENAVARRERKKTIRRLREQQEDIQRRIAELEEAARPFKRVKTEIKPDPEWATYKINNDGVVDLTAN